MNDHDALRALLQRYARATDDRDIEALATLFHPEALIVGARRLARTSTSGWNTCVRRACFPQSMHVLGDPLIDVDEESRSAHLDTYAVVYQLNDQASEGADLTLGMRYYDDAVVHRGNWVFSSRKIVTLWMR